MTVCQPRWTHLEICKTDADGRFRLEITVKAADEDVWIGVRGTDDQRSASPSSRDAPPQHILHPPRVCGVVDVGEVILDGREFTTRLDDAGAEALLQAWSTNERSSFGVGEFREAILADLSRRSPEYWIPVLESLWQYTDFKREWEDWTRAVRVGDLEMLTTLRRLQGRPDPLHIELTEAQPLVVEAPGTGWLPVRLVNRDVEGASFQLTHGGDYRSGRLERWSIEAVDAAGRDVPPASFLAHMWGGMSQTISFALNDSAEAVLDLLHYVGPLPPGEYRLRVLYHNAEPIAPPECRTWRVVSTSEEVALRVVPRKIAITKAEAAELRKQFDALDPNTPVLLLDSGSAGKQLRIETPQSPEEHLLDAGWRAVPILLEALDDEQTTVGLRAWALALLFDITGLVNPESEPNAIGSARYVVLGRSVAGGVGIAGGSGTRSSEPPQPDDQEKLIDRWRGLRGLIEVDVR